MVNNLKKYLLVISIICSLMLVGVSALFSSGMILSSDVVRIQMGMLEWSETDLELAGNYAARSILIGAASLLLINVLLYSLRKRMKNSSYVITFVVVLIVSILMASALTSNYFEIILNKA